MLRARIPDYKVKMGFGLHVGWGIEGAIGSSYKIDASYLSPNVNLASRLEAATKQYGVQILVSGEIQSLFSHHIKKLTREIDTVTVKGSAKPMRFFTTTLHTDNLKEVEDRFESLSHKEKKSVRTIEKQTILDKIFSGRRTTWDLISRDSDFREMRATVNMKVERLFAEGYNRYIAGDWGKAEDIFVRCLQMNPKDGPSITLQKFIEGRKGFPPANWKGFRELTEK